MPKSILQLAPHGECSVN